jgi:hypothetical protein
MVLDVGKNWKDFWGQIPVQPVGTKRYMPFAKTKKIRR